jgi:hypothetical protein
VDAVHQVLGGHHVLSARLQRHLPEKYLLLKWTLSARFWAITVYFPPAFSDTCRKSIYFKSGRCPPGSGWSPCAFRPPPATSGGKIFIFKVIIVVLSVNSIKKRRTRQHLRTLDYKLWPPKEILQDIFTVQYTRYVHEK